jgi:hypothetical protein
MRPDLTNLVALAERGRQLRDRQLDRLAEQRPTLDDVARWFGVPRRLLGRPVDGGR